MNVARRSQRGFARPEIMIYVAMIGVGAALVIPTVQRLIRGEAVGVGGWILLVVGAGIGLFGLFPFCAWTVSSWIDVWRKR